MNPDLLALLRKVDTPTVCNAIEVVQGRRGFSRFTRGTMIASAPQEGAMVGYAVTAKIAALAPPMEEGTVIRARRMAYYRAMHDGPKPSVAVVEDLDFPNCIGAYWGEVNTTTHKAFGISGALTNGVMRDLGDLPAGFPVVAGSVGPSHGFVHVRELGTTVKIFGLEIAQGDLVHADRHGAVVIPPETVENLGAAIRRLMETEKLIKIGARLVNHGRYVAFQMAEVAIPRHLFAEHPAHDRGPTTAACHVDCVVHSDVACPIENEGRGASR